MKKRSGRYPSLAVDGQGPSVVPNAGAVVLLRTAEAVGLDEALSQAMAPWRRPLARHDPGKILLELAVSLAVGGDCLADLAQLRAALTNRMAARTAESVPSCKGPNGKSTLTSARDTPRHTALATTSISSIVTSNGFR
ncbi:transposase [Modestobacter muralis]